jgi:hypothetical protein
MYIYTYLCIIYIYYIYILKGQIVSVLLIPQPLFHLARAQLKTAFKPRHVSSCELLTCIMKQVNSSTLGSSGPTGKLNS